MLLVWFFSLKRNLDCCDGRSSQPDGAEAAARPLQRKASIARDGAKAAIASKLIIQPETKPREVAN